MAVNVLCPCIRHLVKKTASVTPVSLEGRNDNGFSWTYNWVLPTSALTIGSRGSNRSMILVIRSAKAQCRSWWRLAMKNRTSAKSVSVMSIYAVRVMVLVSGIP